jgi:hypothetical protein
MLTKCLIFLIATKPQFSWQIFIKFTNINFMQIHAVGAKMFHANKQKDGPTD